MPSKIDEFHVRSLFVLNLGETIMVGYSGYLGLQVLGLLLASALHFDLSTWNQARWTVPSVGRSWVPLDAEAAVVKTLIAGIAQKDVYLLVFVTIGGTGVVKLGRATFHAHNVRVEAQLLLLTST